MVLGQKKRSEGSEMICGQTYSNLSIRVKKRRVEDNYMRPREGSKWQAAGVGEYQNYLRSNTKQLTV